MIAESPCIDAGDPEAPLDPDGTRADIGAFFFPQCNLAVDSTRYNFDSSVGEDTLEVVIRNIGLRDLTVFSVELVAAEGSPFGLLGEPIIDAIIEPGDSLSSLVRFSPPEPSDYLAELRIISNDRDQDTLTIDLVGYWWGVEDESSDAPISFSLSPAFPNPFNSVTTLEYSLPHAGWVSLKLYDLNGREVVDLVDGVDGAGRHSVTLDAACLAAGVYLAELRSAGEVKRQKVAVVK